MSMKKRINNKGFTLIELLAVIVILGILMMMAIPAVTKYIENSRKDAFYQTAKSYIEAARTTLLNGEYQMEYINNTFGGGIQSQDVCDLPPAGSINLSDNSEWGYYTSIPIEQIELEKGKEKSPFNRTWDSGYVIAINKATVTTANPNPKDDIEYYFAAIDKGKNGIDVFTSESNLKRSSVKKGSADAKNGLYAVGTHGLNKVQLKIDGKYYYAYLECKQ